MYYKARAKRSKFHLTHDQRCDVIIEVESRHVVWEWKNKRKQLIGCQSISFYYNIHCAAIRLPHFFEQVPTVQ